VWSAMPAFEVWQAVQIGLASLGAPASKRERLVSSSTAAPGSMASVPDSSRPRHTTGSDFSLASCDGAGVAAEETGAAASVATPLRRAPALTLPPVDSDTPRTPRCEGGRPPLHPGSPSRSRGRRTGAGAPQDGAARDSGSSATSQQSAEPAGGDAVDVEAGAAPGPPGLAQSLPSVGTAPPHDEGALSGTASGSRSRALQAGAQRCPQPNRFKQVPPPDSGGAERGTFTDPERASPVATPVAPPVPSGGQRGARAINVPPGPQRQQAPPQTPPVLSGVQRGARASNAPAGPQRQESTSQAKLVRAQTAAAGSGTPRSSRGGVRRPGSRGKTMRRTTSGSQPPQTFGEPHEDPPHD